MSSQQELFDKIDNSKRRALESLAYAYDSPSPTGRHVINDRPTKCDCGHLFISHAATNHYCYSCKKWCPSFNLKDLGTRK